MSARTKTCHRISKEEFILLCLLALGNVVLTKSLEGRDEKQIENPEANVAAENTTETTATKKPFLIRPTILKNVADGQRSATVADKKSSGNATDFRPSVHLGEIVESRIRAGPFNNVHHVKFDSSVDPHREQLRNFRLGVQSQQNQEEETFRESVPIVEQSEDEPTRPTIRVKFPDTVGVPGIRYEPDLKEQPLVLHPVENVGAQYEVVDQQVFHELDKPYGQESLILGKPTKFQGESQTHGLGTASLDGSRLPYVGGLQDYHGYQALQDYATKKPENVVYVQESSFTRTRKYPYPYYQPAGYLDINLQDEAHSVGYSGKKRVSPWKKVLHLIGAILPFGLLLASLTPNVVKIGNTTQPNIVLSKLRIAELPVEHKQARLVDEFSKICEERSICELILAGGKTGSNSLQNVLWNLAARTSEAAAEENGLQQVFEAARKKNCAKIAC